MPSPMEGSSREGDLFTVKHELKNGKRAGFTLNAVGFICRLSLRDTCPVEMLAVSWLAWEIQLSLPVSKCTEREHQRYSGPKVAEEG